MHLRPDNDKPATEIPVGRWATLTSTEERGNLIPAICDRKNRGWLDPAYTQLEELLRDIALHLQADLHWVNK